MTYDGQPPQYQSTYQAPPQNPTQMYPPAQPPYQPPQDQAWHSPVGYPTPPGFQPRGATKPRRGASRWLIPVIVGVVGLIIGLVAGKSSSSNAASSGSLATATTTVTATVTTTAKAATPAKTTAAAAKTTAAAPPAGPKTVLSLQGSGIKNTAHFGITKDQWTIAYTYNCANFGQSGNFSVSVYRSDGTPSDVAANELGTGGTGSTVEHGSGTYYLAIDSECNWHLTVTE